MIKALKGAMIAYGVIVILLGLATIFIPDKMAELWRLREIADYSKFFLAGAGGIYVAAGVWVVAAGRDPVRYISWVKFAITKCVLTVFVNLYAIPQGYVVFSQVGRGIITDAVSGIALLSFYPWRTRQGRA